jgi:hypothetical protein
MSHSTDFTGKQLPHRHTQKDVTPGVILHIPAGRPRKNAKMLKGNGIHGNCIEDALKGSPHVAKVIDLAEYRWMRLFDEL